LVKDVGPAGLSAVAAGAKPSSLLEPGREIAVYRDLLTPAALSTPRFHGASVDEREGRWWLFLERVDGEVLTDVGQLAVWQEVAAWIAGLGAAVGERRSPQLDGVLVDRDASWHGHWIDAAIAALNSHGKEAVGGRLAERLRQSRDALLEQLDALPQTFVHGELYPSNVVVDRSGGGPTRIAPVDWELAGRGPYALDLAALVSGWDGDESLAMCGAYHDSLALGQGNAASLDELVEAVNLCRLVLALQWIGWAPGWQAPEAHRHDWVAEAASLLEEVNL
jgi:aminoglycoside phosphotransferase (APT) family kinase protein